MQQKQTQTGGGAQQTETVLKGFKTLAYFAERNEGQEETFFFSSHPIRKSNTRGKKELKPTHKVRTQAGDIN